MPTMSAPEWAIIGGSGFAQLAELAVQRSQVVTTPYGAPSCALQIGKFPPTQQPQSQPSAELVFLARHGNAAPIPPHAINYRANLYALHQIGVKRIVALAAVGGVAPHLSTGKIVIPHQLIDYTWGRAHTFFDGDANPLRHAEFAEPYHPSLRQAIIAAAKTARVEVVESGVMGVTQGPRLETVAEIARLARDGVDLVGMTGMPEAVLAAELGIAYASIAMVVNPAAGLGTPISLDAIMANLARIGKSVVKILRCYGG